MPDIKQETLEEAGRLKGFWRPRNEYLAMHRDLVSGSYRRKVAKYELVISNEPKSLVELACSILAGKQPLIRFPITNQEEPERNVMNDAERWARAVFKEWDRRHRRRLHGPWLRELTWYKCMGGVALFPHIAPGGRQGIQFRCDIWDIMDVFPETGDDGLIQVIRSYSTTMGVARSMAEAPGWNPDVLADGKADQDVDVVNRWWVEDGKVWNTVLINETVVLEPVERREFRGAIPIIVSGANGVPYRSYTDTRKDVDQGNAPDWRKQWSRPITDTNYELYINLDKLLTYMLQNAHDHAYGMGVSTTKDGQTVLTQPDAVTGDVKLLALRVGEDFNWKSPPQIPVEVHSLLQYLTAGLSKGGLDPVLYGSLGSLDISGVTLDRLIAGTKSKLQPYGESIEDDISQAFMTTQALFKRQRRKVQLAFVGDDMRFYQEGFEPSKIPDTTDVKVELPMALPDNRFQKMTMAQMALPGEPLLDPITVYEQFLQDIVPDPSVVIARLDEMRASKDPLLQEAANIVALKRKRRAAEEEGDQDMVEAIDLVIQARQAAFNSSVALNQNRNDPPRTALREPRPEVQPAEGGAVPPDEINALADRGNNGAQAVGSLAERRRRNMGA
jgi:hypothetical protein